MKNLLCFVSFLLPVFCGFSYAQSAAGSSRDVTPADVNTSLRNQIVEEQDTMYQTNRGIPMPQDIQRLIEEGKDIQAIDEFSKFKKKQRKADKFSIAYLEMSLYRNLAMFCPSKSNQYSSQAQFMINRIIQDFPDESDVYLLQIRPESTPEQIIELSTKAIKADPENINAYEVRARALFQLGKSEEGCADLEKIPYKSEMTEYWQCGKK